MKKTTTTSKTNTLASTRPKSAIAVTSSTSPLSKIGVIEPSAIGQDPALSRSFRGHEDQIISIAFDPKTRSVASASKDSIVNVWNFKPSMRPFKFSGHKGAVHCVRYSPDGETIASSSSDRTIKLWSNSVQAKCTTIKAHVGGIRSVDYSVDGAYLLSCSDDKSSKLWRISDKKFLFGLTGHSHWVRSGVISPDMRIIATGSEDKSSKLWDLHSQTLLNTFAQHSDGVSQVLFHPDGTCVATASLDHHINLTDIRSNKLVQHYVAHDGPVNSISIHPSGYFLASAGGDSKIKMWDLRQGRQIYTLYSNDKDVSAVSFSSSGEYFATGGTQNLCMVWKTNFDSEVQNIDQIQKKTIIEYSTGGLYKTTNFKTNKLNNIPSGIGADQGVSRSHPIFVDTYGQPQDQENKQSNSPTFSQQHGQYQQSVEQQSKQQSSRRDQKPLEFEQLPPIPFHPQEYRTTNIINKEETTYSNSQQSSQFQAHPAQVLAPPPKSIGFTSVTAYLPPVPEENLINGALAASLQQIYSRIDSMAHIMESIDHRVSKQEQILGKETTHGNQVTFPNYQSTSPNEVNNTIKRQSVRFGEESLLSASIVDRNPLNIFSTGGLGNATNSIEGSLLKKQVA